MTHHNHHEHHAPPIIGRRLMSSAAYRGRRGGISEMTRWRDEKAGIGPKPVKINGRNFYFEDEVDSFLNELAAIRQHGDEE